MAPRTGWKLYLIGCLSVVSLTLGVLVLTGVMSAENRSSVGLQYLVVGVLLAAIFFALGGLTALAPGRRPAQPNATDDGRPVSVDTEQSIVSEVIGSEDPDPLPRGPIIGLNGDRGLSEDLPSELDDGGAVAETALRLEVAAEETTPVEIEPDALVEETTLVASEPDTATEDDAAMEESSPAVAVAELGPAAVSSVVKYSPPTVEPAGLWGLTDQVVAAVRHQESQLVDRLIDEGLLTTEGPITERDVRAMVWVAVSSIELADNLVRGVLDHSPAELAAAPQTEMLLPRTDAVE
ncbi:MAG: hypothetical protein ACN4GZ_01435 [Acidimicrobiales bacterium]